MRRLTSGGDSERVRTGRIGGRRRGEAALAARQAGEFLACPVGHELPDGYLTVPTKTVALVGPSLSMKTHYLAIDPEREGPAVWRDPAAFAR